MGHLDKLAEEKAEKGLSVIAITRQGRAAVDAFIEETGAKHTIIIEGGDSMRSYGSRSWPTNAQASAVVAPRSGSAGTMICARCTVVPLSGWSSKRSA